MHSSLIAAALAGALILAGCSPQPSTHSGAGLVAVQHIDVAGSNLSLTASEQADGTTCYQYVKSMERRGGVVSVKPAQVCVSRLISMRRVDNDHGLYVQVPQFIALDGRRCGTGSVDRYGADAIHFTMAKDGCE